MLSLSQYAYITSPTPSKVKLPNNPSFPIEEVQFKGGDDLTMAGWFTPPQNEATIILLHGYGNNRTSMLWHAEQLTAAGYGVLMYDERASGESEGSHRSYGWQDPADVGGAITYLNGRSDINPDKIGIAGCSIGGQIALQSAVAYPEIKAIWAGDPSGVRASDHAFPKRPADALVKFVRYIQDLELTLFLNLDAPPPLKNSVGSIAPRPITWVVSGKQGRFASAEKNDVLYVAQSAGENSEIWIIEESKHCNGPNLIPEEYAAKMVTFFNNSLDISPE